MRREFHDVTKMKINVKCLLCGHKTSASSLYWLFASSRPQSSSQSTTSSPHTNTSCREQRVYVRQLQYLHDIFLVLVSYIYVSTYIEPKIKVQSDFDFILEHGEIFYVYFSHLAFHSLSNKSTQSKTPHGCSQRGKQIVSRSTESRRKEENFE